MLKSIKKILAGRYRYLILPALILTGVLLFIALDFLYPLPHEKINMDRSTVVYYRDGTMARIFLTNDDKYRIHLETDEIPEGIKRAFIASEDRYFHYHAGINPVSIIKAALSNIRRRKIVSGASTITMQIARMAEPKKRTFANKIFECFRALQIEMRYSKEEIITIYLNRLPFGGNIEGIETASRIFFSKPASGLNAGEIAILTMVPRSPGLLHPVRGKSEIAKKARDRALVLMHNNNLIDKDILKMAMETPLPTMLGTFPFEMPHICDFLYYKHNLRGQVHTSIDRSTQQMLEKTIFNYSKKLNNYGIRNITAMIVCNETSSILAATGSEDYHEKTTGQIIGFNARRSPGSLLKPFLYAIAIEDGMMTPDTLLIDTPVYYSDYEPSNFGGIFTGISNAKDALCNSLNIPAVRLLEEIGTQRALSFLRDLGFDLRHEHDHYGLSMVLGSAEITLLEAVRAYSCLNSKGQLNHISFLKSNISQRKSPVYKEGTAYIISEMLRGHNHSSLDNHLPYKVSWKTGTSHRFRDAWAVGYNPYYTIGVWTGNFQGHGTNINTGHNTAAPLMLMLFDALMRNRPPKWYNRPDNIIDVFVCSLSGMLPSSHCPHTKKTISLFDRIPVNRCEYHISLPVDSDGFVTKNPALAEKYEVFTYFPPEVRSWLSINKRLTFNYPRYRQTEDQPSLDPTILFPQNNQVFELKCESDPIPIKIAGNRYTKHYYLFIDDNYIKKYSAHSQITISPEKGLRSIYLADDNGNTSNTVMITVK